MIYEITIARDPREGMLHQSFAHREETDRALALALANYRDCEIRLLLGDVVLASIGPVRK